MTQELTPKSDIKSAIAGNDFQNDISFTSVENRLRLFISPLTKYIPSIPRLKDIYLPFFYLEKVKRTGEKYTLRVILWDDLPVLLLAFSWQANHILLDSLSILFLLVSFWCIYELGYYENDCIAEKYEEKPKLSSTYHVYKHMMETRYPWIWALFFGLIGVALLLKAEGVHLLLGTSLIEANTVSWITFLLPSLYWIGFLASLRFCFWIYNHLNKHTRTWVYLLLQSFRYYGFLAVTSTNPIGTSLLSSHILCRSILYVVYRYSGGNENNWPKQVPEKLLRLLIFMFLLSAIAFGTQSLELWKSWQTWAIIAWCLIQGQGQIIRMLSQVKPVVEDGSNHVKPAT